MPEYESHVNEISRDCLAELCPVKYQPSLPIPRRSARHRTIALANRARFVLPHHVVVEISSLGRRGHQRLVHRLRYVEIAGDRPALELYLKHMRDGVVSDRFQTR